MPKSIRHALAISQPASLADWDPAVANSLLLPRWDSLPANSPGLALADTLLGLCNEAFAHHGDGRLAGAIERYERALSLKPDMPAIRNNLGHALVELGKPEIAIGEYRRAVELKPDYAEALCNWGAALLQLDRLDEAEAKFRRAIAVNPGLAGAHHNLGLILKERGRLDQAQRAAKRAVRLAPRNTSYYEHLAAVRPFEAGDRYLKALEALQRDCASLSARDRVHLHFALARAYQDTGDAESAFAQLLAGNRLKREHTAYDEAATLARMERIGALFTADFIAKRQGAGASSPLPVFIVGMPRSGTTLIEQILASHPAIHGAGELTLFDRTIGALATALPESPPFPDMAAAMSAEHFRKLGVSYVEQVAQLAPAASRIVDKMPGNFLFAGLIHLALPNATIIHATRNPIDTCVSCYSILFTNQAHTYDLGELGRYCRHYQALMAHWHQVLPPGRILDVKYEELVGDLETVARRIVAQCGLPWDPRCLDFHRTDRIVRTASATQVRQPIYQSSVGRWRKYEQFLEPLLAELHHAHGPSPASISDLKETRHA
ncbi:MAG: sulfotransferase [Xanthobacteraceae bacterium]